MIPQPRRDPRGARSSGCYVSFELGDVLMVGSRSCLPDSQPRLSLKYRMQLQEPSVDTKLASIFSVGDNMTLFPSLGSHQVIMWYDRRHGP